MFRTMLLSKYFRKLSSRSLSSVKAGGGSAPATPYQAWAGYPDTPVLTADYPYQTVISAFGNPYLFLATTPFFMVEGLGGVKNAQPLTRYNIVGGVWQFLDVLDPVFASTPIEANNDIYTDATLTVVHFAKTTA